MVIGFDRPSYNISEGDVLTVCASVKRPNNTDILVPTTVNSADGSAKRKTLPLHQL